MQIIHKKSKVLWLMFLLVFISVHQAYAQQQLRGNVTDQDGMPIPGVTVLIKGTQVGTTTDFDGDFQLSVPSDNTVIVLSYIGYQTMELDVRNESFIQVQLEPTVSDLDEVILIGYGGQDRETITGSIASVNADDFNSGNISDPMTLIAGKVAGLATSSPGADPNATTDFSLRGPATISGNSQPLIVIDGVPGGDLQTVAPSNIASIDVLKDASAAAIYGSRATAGVIIVTTKKGVEGAPKLNYSSYVSTSFVNNKYDVLNADQYRQVVDQYGFTLDDAGADTDWFDEVTRDTPISHVHNLSISGGNSNTTYYGGITYRNFEGMDLISERESLNGTFRLNSSAMDDRLGISFMLTNTHDNRDFANYGSLAQSLMMNPTYPVKNPDGTWYQRPDIQYGLQWNPVASLFTNSNNSKESRLIGNLKLDYEVVDGLVASVSYSLIKNSFLSGSFSSREDFFQMQEGVGGQASRSQNHSTSNIVEAVLSYDEQFGDHHINVLGGFSYDNRFNEGFSAGNNSFSTDAFKYYNLGAGSALNNLTPNANRRGVFVGSYADERTLMAGFGRVIYDYQKKYLLNLSYRREGASVLGADNKWGNFWGASAGWVLTNEDFFAGNGTIPHLKIRAGYGVTGNQESLYPYQSLATIGPYYSGSHNAYLGVPGEGRWIQPYGPTINPNPALRWETKKELNVGVDFSLFEYGWLSGSIEYYHRKIENLVGNYTAQLPSNVMPNIFANAGEMQNEGFELALNANVFNRDDFQWNVGLVGAFNKNEIISVSSEQFQGSAHDITRITEGVHVQRLAPGQPVAVFYGRVFAGFTEEGDWLFRNSEGQAVPASEIGEDDFRYLGNSIPEYTWGLTNEFRVGNWDLSALLRGAFGFNVVNGKRMFHENLAYFARQNMFTSVLDGDPVRTSPLFSDYYIEDGAYVKLDNVTIGYTFPMTDSRLIENIRLYATGTNLFTITDFSGSDPEMGVNYYPSDSSNETSNGPGVEPYYGYYPRTSTITFGISANF